MDTPISLDVHTRVADGMRVVAGRIAAGAPLPYSVSRSGTTVDVSVAYADADEWCALLGLDPVVYDTEGPHAGKYGTSVGGDFKVSCYRAAGAPVSA